MAGGEDEPQKVVIERVVGRGRKVLLIHRRTQFRIAAELLGLALWTSARRSRSTPRCLAVAMSQAPGLSGTPDSGHCSSAATSASWARSSASATSRTRRAMPAISRADSIRHTASIVRVTSRPATARLRARCRLRAQSLLPLTQLRCELLSEVVGLEHRADLHHPILARRIGDPPRPRDRLLHRPNLPHPVAG